MVSSFVGIFTLPLFSNDKSVKPLTSTSSGCDCCCIICNISQVVLLLWLSVFVEGKKRAVGLISLRC